MHSWRLSDFCSFPKFRAGESINMDTLWITLSTRMPDAYESMFGKTRRPAVPTPPALKKPRTTVVQCQATKSAATAVAAASTLVVAEAPPFDERVMRCWLSGLSDPYGGLVDSCHIVDACLLGPGDDEARYSPDARIKLHKTLHAAWDQRLLTIHPDGTISTALSDSNLTALGISRRSRLPSAVLNPRRTAFLKARPNGHCEFMLQSQSRKANRRECAGK